MIFPHRFHYTLGKTIYIQLYAHLNLLVRLYYGINIIFFIVFTILSENNIYSLVQALLNSIVRQHQVIHIISLIAFAILSGNNMYCLMLAHLIIKIR